MYMQIGTGGIWT